MKILIRLARTSREIAERILSHSSLIRSLIYQFEKVGSTGDRTFNDYFCSFLYNFNIFDVTPGTFSRIQKSKVFTLKLFRILCSYGERLIDQLHGYGLKSVLRSAIFVQESNITVREGHQK